MHNKKFFTHLGERGCFVLVAEEDVDVLKDIQLLVGEIFDEEGGAQIHHQNLVLFSRVFAKNLDCPGMMANLY